MDHITSPFKPEDDKVIKSVVFTRQNEDLLLWALSTRRNFSELCREALREKQARMQSQPPAASGPAIDPGQLQRLVELAVRRALANLTIVRAADDQPPTISDDQQEQARLDEKRAKLKAMF